MVEQRIRTVNKKPGVRVKKKSRSKKLIMEKENLTTKPILIHKKKSTKGALIKGITRKLPSVIIDNPVFKKRLREIMKGYSGIYALYHKNRLYYVGLASNLLSRINWHLKDRHANKWDSFVIFRIKRIKFLKDIETLITHIMDIPGNRLKGQVPRDADINRVLKEILREHETEIKLIKKSLQKKKR